MDLGFKRKNSIAAGALASSKEQKENFLEKLNADLRARQIAVRQLGSVKLTQFHVRDMQSIGDLRWDLRDGVLLCMLLKVGREEGNIRGLRLCLYFSVAAMHKVGQGGYVYTLPLFLCVGARRRPSVQRRKVSRSSSDAK